MRDWEPIATAPFERDLELAVVDDVALYRLVFPCRRALHGWVNARTAAPVKVFPTHWREWVETVTPISGESGSS